MCNAQQVLHKTVWSNLQILAQRPGAFLCREIPKRNGTIVIGIRVSLILRVSTVPLRFQTRWLRFKHNPA